MQNVYNSKGEPILLLKEIGRGGEGSVWETNLSTYLAKIYRIPDLDKQRKIQAMLANPPENPTAASNHLALAWPTEILTDNRNNFVGFLMPYIRNKVDLKYVCNPSLRKVTLPRFDWRYLHTTAKNLAWLIHKIHAKDYILGDISVKNLLVSDRPLVSVIDTDSFQMYDREGRLYRCQVGSEGFTPPELLDKQLPEIAQTRAHDCFRLAILIHHLLFGQTPFAGEWIGQGEMPPENKLVREGVWPYAPNSRLRQSSRTIPLEVVHPVIKDLFLRCFNEGHLNASRRPTAKEWYEALEVAIKDLVNCTQVNNHVYSKTYGTNYNQCYWCYRAKNLGVDIFEVPPPKQSSPTPSPTPPPSPIPQPSTSSAKSSHTSRKGCLILLGILVVVIILVVFVPYLIK